jgi:hypothetical protein
LLGYRRTYTRSADPNNQRSVTVAVRRMDESWRPIGAEKDVRLWLAARTLTMFGVPERLATGLADDLMDIALSHLVEHAERFSVRKS